MSLPAPRASTGVQDIETGADHQQVTERFQPTARVAIAVESFSNGVEAVMTYASRLLPASF